MARTVGLSIPVEVQELLKEYAWRNRKSMSRLVTELVLEFVAKEQQKEEEV